MERSVRHSQWRDQWRDQRRSEERSAEPFQFKVLQLLCNCVESHVIIGITQYLWNDSHHCTNDPWNDSHRWHHTISLERIQQLCPHQTAGTREADISNDPWNNWHHSHHTTSLERIQKLFPSSTMAKRCTNDESRKRPQGQS